MDVLQSLVGVNMRFNKIAYDLVFTHCFALLTWSSDDVILPEKLPNLQSFSLKCDCETFLYDELILPLLHRMLHLEEPALYLVLSMQIFLDGNNFKKNIINHLSRLKKVLIFDNKVICCVDYFRENGLCQCHIYSYPYSLTHYRRIANSFPGGFFKCVRQVSLSDECPFEHEFFLRIAQSFPCLKTLSVTDWKAQKHKHCRTRNGNDKRQSIIEYPHLANLDLLCVHVDYVTQFLDNKKTSIPNNLSVCVDYRSLRKATHNFTRDTS
ncbi:unnamed protein product [Rotaria sp. Silwood2]|nr:unnamed protein product [Rotaria sp. Silwood2]CAF4416149.1 unnamed protein product [Rotaria sp. Silwood2]